MLVVATRRGHCDAIVVRVIRSEHGRNNTRFLAVFRRRPMFRSVLHFTMKLINYMNEDFELIGVQVFYNL